MAEFVKAMVCVPGWVELTEASPEWWATEMIGKPVVYMGRQSGYVRETWVEDGGVMAEIEIDPSAEHLARQLYADMAIA